MSLLTAGARRPDIPALTSLRFFAALWVVLFHVREIGFWKGGVRLYQATIALGYLGVSFFFVLSGFILVYVYSDREIPKGRFWQSRFARIYPAYLFSLLITLPGLLYAWPMMKKMHLTALVLTSFPLLLEAWFPKVLFFWNTVAWSLSVEVFFYLLFPFLLRPLQRLSTRGLWTTAALAWLSALAVTGAYVLFRPDGVSHTSSQDNELVWLAVVKFNPLVRLPEFLLGMVAGAMYLRLRSEDRQHPDAVQGSTSRAWAPATWCISIGSAAVVLVTILQHHLAYPMLHSGMLAPAFALIVFGFAAGTPSPAGEGPSRRRWDLGYRLLASRPLLLLGEASYSLYLLHIMPIVIMTYVLHLNTSPHVVLWVLVLLAGVSLVSIGVLLGIENPLRRRLRPHRRVMAATTGEPEPLPVGH